MQVAADSTSPSNSPKHSLMSVNSASVNSAPSLSHLPFSVFSSNLSHFFSIFSRHLINFLINLQTFFKHLSSCFYFFFLSLSDNSPASSSYKVFMSPNFSKRSAMIFFNFLSFFAMNLRNLFWHLFKGSKPRLRCYLKGQFGGSTKHMILSLINSALSPILPKSKFSISSRVLQGFPSSSCNLL